MAFSPILNSRSNKFLLSVGELSAKAALAWQGSGQQCFSMTPALPHVYAILDGDILASRNLGLQTAAEALLEGGLRLLQLRLKSDYNRSAFSLAVSIAQLCHQTGALFVVNDRADIAVLLKQKLGFQIGVHVGQDDLTPSDVRRITGPDALVGLSTHNQQQFLAADRERLSYVALGPVFGTASKSRPDPAVGTAELSRLRPFFTGPVVAIGGITRERAVEVWRAGADSVAVISDLYPEIATKNTVRQRAEEWMSIASEQGRQLN